MTELDDTSERIVWDGWCSIALPPEWSCSEENGVITVLHEQGVGALQMSFATRERTEPATNEEALELIGDWASDQGLTDVGIKTPALAAGPAASIEYVQDDGEGGSDYWRVWQLVDDTRAAFITYNCRSGDADLERAERESILASFRWD